MKRKVNVKKTVKVFEVYLVLILLATLFMSIAFANISDIKLNLTGNVTAIVQEGVFISDVARTDVQGYIADNIKYYRKTALSTTIELESRPQIVEGEIGPYITYAVSLYNNSGEDYYYTGLTYDPYAYDNTKISAAADTLKPYITTIHPREELKFNLTFKYADGVTASSSQELNSILNFDFLNDYIEFTVDGEKYTAPNEITWEQFIESEYNTDSFKLQNEKIYTSDNKCILLEETPVALEDKITKDAKYIKENIDITLTMNSEDTLTQGESAIYIMSTSSNGGKIEENNLTAKVVNNSNKEVGTATVSQGVYKIYGNSIQNGTPSPETPIEVESVGDKTKNLFNQAITKTASFSEFSNTSVRSFEEGVWYLGLTLNNYSAPTRITSYTLNELSTTFTTTANPYGITQAFKCEPNQIYSFSCDKSVANSNIGFGFYDADGNFISYQYWQGSSITTPENCYWMTVSFCGVTNGEATYSNAQLVLGDLPNEFEPYGKYKIPVKVSGKNLFNKNDIQEGYYIDDADGNIKSLRENYASNYMKVPAGKEIYITKQISGNWGAFYDENKEYVSGVLGYGLYVVPSNAKYLRITINPDYIDTMQVEINSTETEYNAYVEPTITNIYLDEPLRKVGDSADYIDLETGKVVRNIKTFEFTSNTNLATYTWNNKVGVYAYIGLDNAYSRVPGLSNRNNVFVSSLDAETSMWIGVNNRNLFWLGILDYLGFEDDETTTAVEKLKAWLANNPTYVYYATSTPDYTETVDIPELNITSDYTTVEVLTEVQPSSIEAAVGSDYRIKVDTSALSAGTYKIKVPARAFVTNNNTYSEQAISTDKFTLKASEADNTISGDNTITG